MMMESRNGSRANKGDGDSLAGGISIDAPTQAFRQDQQSMYASYKDGRSGKDDGDANRPESSLLLKLKDRKGEDELLVKGNV